jgi:hypothetical protein
MTYIQQYVNLTNTFRVPGRRAVPLHVLLVAILFLHSASIAAPADVQYIPAREYSQVLVREIDSAKLSVRAVLYLFSLYPNRPQSKTMQLASALIAARKRGCVVEIVLDKGEFSAGFDGPSEAGGNAEAYEYLSDRGVQVRYAEVPAIVHAKTAVIDSQTVIVGSANWSESGLTRNVEASVLIRSPDVARELLKEMGNLNEKVLPTIDSVIVRLPMAFFSDKGAACRMVSSSDERAFDLYCCLYHIAGDGKHGTIVLNYDTAATHLGILSMGREAYRRQLNKVLDKLHDRYGLADVKTGFGKDAEITLAETSGDTVSVAAGYWDFGWERRLGFPGKVMYALNLYYSSVSLSRPRWSMAAENIAQRHGLSRWFVITGTTELRRANLVDVVYDDIRPETAVEPRHSNVYTPLALYDPAKLELQWKDLENRFGKEKTDRARACATLVYKDNDYDAVEKFIALEEKYGKDKMEQAKKIMSEKAPDNPKRCVGYFVGTVMGLK